MTKSVSHVVVIGAGAWGSALAQAAAVAGNDVTLLGRDESLIAEINRQNSNSKYLGEIVLSKAIQATCDVGALSTADMVILAVPAQKTRGVIRGLSSDLKRAVPVVVTAKGFEAQTLALQSEIVNAEWKNGIPIVLSGPSFAVDVAANRPSAVTIAGSNPSILKRVVGALSSDHLRPYSSNDPFGVQLCGGLKNVYALASGAIEGAGLGLSARSAFVARAFNEMGNLVAVSGGRNASVSGLAGIGDLMLSCTSAQSRNYRFGIELGKGKSVVDIQAMGLGLTEGVSTTPVALALAEREETQAPLVTSVNALLEGKFGVTQIVKDLMRRKLKSEGS